LELHNLTILPQQPPKGVPAYLSAADVALVPLRKIDLFKETVPSKLFDAWACERPVILGVDGEARRLLEDAQAGIFVPPEDPRAVASALIRLRDDPALCQSMGQNGRLVTVQNYSRQAQANKLAELLESKFVSAHR